MPLDSNLPGAGAAPQNVPHVISTPDPLSAATRRSILLLSFAAFASIAAQRMCDAMLPELSRAFSVSLGQAAQVVSVYAITYGVAQLLFGPLGDRFGKFRVVTYATLGSSVGCLVAMLAGSFDVLLVARFLTALGTAALIPLAMAWVGDSVPNDRLQEMLTRTGLGNTLGLVTGQLLGGILTDALGWRWCFAFLTLLFAGVGGLLYLDLRRQQAGAAAAPVAAVADAGGDSPRPHFIRQTIGIFAGSWARMVLAVALVEGAAVYGSLAIYASHLHVKLGLSLSMSGAVVALFGLGGMLFMVAGRYLIRRLGQRGMALAGGLMIGAGCLLIAVTSHWLPAAFAALLAGFGFFMFHNTMQANATAMAPHARGTAVTLFASVLFLGQSVGVVVVSALLGRLGSSVVIALAGGVMAVLGVVFSLALRRQDV
ncbi:MAG: major facilitator superfamily 1 [Polaromonas sp.]|nr:major facilitator superfamily 1 [Polaromonas sp.]